MIFSLKGVFFLFFDSHAHLDDSRFSSDREELIASLPGKQIDGFINIGSSLETSKFSVHLAERYPFVYAAAGIHPEAAGRCDSGVLQKIDALLSHEKCVALGEIGLDFYYDTPEKSVQTEVFEAQCRMAAERGIPVIIHDREAHAPCFEMVKKYGLRGVFHCFSGSAEMAEELVKLGFYISFTGVLTFKNAKKAVLAAERVPLDRLMIETDCPYMAPEPHRGERNDPSMVRFVCEKLAKIKQVSLDEAARITKENACRLFGIPPEISRESATEFPK